MFVSILDRKSFFLCAVFSLLSREGKYVIAFLESNRILIQKARCVLLLKLLRTLVFMTIATLNCIIHEQSKITWWLNPQEIHIVCA